MVAGTGSPGLWSRDQACHSSRSILDNALKSCGLVVDSPARNRELDLMILVSPLQCEIFYDPTVS